MRLLVLGGTRHVGRAVVECALARGDEVTVVNRGLSGPPAAGVLSLRADRTQPGRLADALGGRSWDAVVDTWDSAPSVVRASADLLADRAGHYAYVSSRSVYQWPIPLGADESAPVVDADPAAGSTAYPADKRGAEIAVQHAFGDRALIARAGLVLGPYELSGRLPWWLQRAARGGPMLAPGPPQRPLQLIDARDLAGWMLAGADHGLHGVMNAVSRPGHATMRSLLEAVTSVTGSHARLVWVPAPVIEAAGIQAWTELPIWMPPEGDGAGMHAGDVSRALANGLVCRPVTQTVQDTWEWLQREGFPQPRTDRPPIGLDPAREQELLAAAGASDPPGPDPAGTPGGGGSGPGHPGEQGHAAPAG